MLTFNLKDIGHKTDFRSSRGARHQLGLCRFHNSHLDIISTGEAPGQRRGIKTASDRLLLEIFNTLSHFWTTSFGCER